jgi:hypothetical protein
MQRVEIDVTHVSTESRQGQPAIRPDGNAHVTHR